MPLLLMLLLINCDKRVKESNGSLNRLANASSPYLQEHADNPVDWYEWGSEALEKARAENKPLIISIGYSSCHWCHVMEEESFMDTAVARIMNQNFVAIKIDREERPDIDQIYLEAAQLISGNSGWPLNAFALPDGKPFYAATYFPKQQWTTILQQVSEAYKKQYNSVTKQAAELTRTLQEDVARNFKAADGISDSELYSKLFSKWQSDFDFDMGGLKGSQKFPLPVVWEFLLQFNFLTGKKEALQMVTTTLTQMGKGGLYDHIGGGFSRYCTDSNWRVPHFEKMLYDNAQLVSLYSHAYQVTKNPEYAEIVDETLLFIKNELTSAEGGFYASINADSEGEEGKFYVWTKKEITQALDQKATALVTDFYHVTDSGNWEGGKNILFTTLTRNEFATAKSLSKEAFDKALSQTKNQLRALRNKRVRPSTDKKILLSWNAMMLKGYLDAFFAFGNDGYLEIALKNARFIEQNMIRANGQLWRSYNGGKPGTEAFLDDYALLARAYIKLYEATFDIHWLDQARSMASYAVDHFRDKQSGLFFYTSDLSENLIARKMELTDNVMPSSNSVMAEVLYLLGEYYLESTYIDMSHGMLNSIASNLESNGPFFANWATILGMITSKPYEVAIVGKEASSKSKQVQRHYLPTAIFLGGDDENLPLLKNKRVKGRTIVYVCRNKICKAPQEDVEKALEELLASKIIAL